MAVLLDALLQQLAVKVLLPVISVKQDSTQTRALPSVPSAHLAVRMRMRTLPHRALSVQVAHMQSMDAPQGMGLAKHAGKISTMVAPHAVVAPVFH